MPTHKEAFQQAFIKDPEMRALADLIITVWPKDIKEVPHPLRPYWQHRETLGMTSYILFVMYIILLVYVLMTIHILLRYIILLIHMMIITGYHNVIVILFLIGYHIFCTLLPECYYEAILLDVLPPNHHI